MLRQWIREKFKFSIDQTKRLYKTRPKKRQEDEEEGKEIENVKQTKYNDLNVTFYRKLEV